MSRVGLLFLVGAFAAAPLGASAQTCTIGPFSGSTTISSINSQLNSAPNGAVVCMQRGATWSSATGFTLTTSHPDSSRVTLCASTGSQCSPPGSGANPKINITDGGNNRCVSFMGVTGYNLKNIDCFAKSTTFAYDVRKSSAHITIDGGVVDGWWAGAFFDNGTGPYVDDVKLGVCGNRVEIRNGPPPTGNLRFATWGPTTNSSMSVWIHDFTGTNQGGQDHMIDLGQNGSADPYHATNNLTIECSLFQYSGGGEMGTYLKAARGTNLTVRDSTFEVIGNGCSAVKALAFDSHYDSAVEGWDGAEIYRNVFKMGKCAAIVEAVGKNIKIYNNVAIGQADDYQRGLIQFWYNAGDPTDLQVSNVAIFNNTIYRTGNTSTPGNGYALVSDNAQIASGRQTGTGLSLYNNLFYNLDGVDAKIWTSSHGGCNGWGANGANIRNNYIYTPNDSSPSYWGGCSGATGTNSNFRADPGLVDPANGNFSLSPTSVIAGKGIAAGAPTNGDFTKGPRQSPPSIGAYDMSGGGGVVPLDPPVLLQISAN